MIADARAEIRPRTTGELLDDAWRLCLVDAPLLLALSGLFAVPTAVVLLFLLAQPLPEGSRWRWLLPALAAMLLPLTGLGSGACQEVLRCRAEGRTAGLLSCLAAALQRGVDHIAARALLLMLVVLGSLFLLLPGLTVWILLLPMHVLIASGRYRLLPAVGAALTDARRAFARAAAVAGARLLLLGFALLNLHVLINAGLWAASHLGGMDTALLELLCSLANPVYLLSLVMLAWLLLTPFGEAANYLLHVDTRARFEGLDLWDRIQRLFPGSGRQRTGAAGLLLLLLPASAVGAAEDRRAVVQEARREVQQIREEVRTADPYPGGDRWAGRLEALARRLSQERPCPWFTDAIEGFRRRQRASALHVLADLDRRLALVEESLTLPRETPAAGEGRQRRSREEIQRLLPAGPDTVEPTPTPRERDKEPEVVQRADDRPAGGKRRGTALVGPSTGGLQVVGWLVLAGLLMAVLVLAIVLCRRNRRQAPAASAPQTGELAATLESVLTDPAQSAAKLWQRAEELARNGDYLEAVRLLYLAVLVGLHRANLIRFERTHTNGEYVQQLRRASAAVTPVFRRLVLLFEEKWYGERACTPEDYQTCRAMASEVREQMTA